MGEDLISFYIENRNNILQETEERYKAHLEAGDCTVGSPWWKSVIGALVLLESFYGETFEELTITLSSVMREHKLLVDSDPVEQALEELSNWLVRNSLRFVNEHDEYMPGELYGIHSHQKNELWIFTEVFDSFCREKGISKTAFLRALEQKGILVTDSTKLAARRYIQGRRTRVYVFKASAFSLEFDKNRVITDDEVFNL